MSKSIVVINTPRNCGDCPCLYMYEFDGKLYDYECSINEKKLLVEEMEKNKPDWCPLKDVPHKKPTMAMGEWLTYNCGYNSCIDEILEKNE